MPIEHVRFFKRLRLCHRTEDCLCSHGGVDCRIGVTDQPRDALIWGAGGFPEAYSGRETIVYGHWNNAVVGANGWPSPLTGVRLPDGAIFKSARHRC